MSDDEELPVVTENCSVREKRCSDDRIGRVLSAQQCRILLALLDESVLSADPILRTEEVLHPGEYRTVCYELHHVLLPELVDKNFIEFDRLDDEVRRGVQFDEARRFLEQRVADDAD